MTSVLQRVLSSKPTSVLRLQHPSEIGDSSSSDKVCRPCSSVGISGVWTRYQSNGGKIEDMLHWMQSMRIISILPIKIETRTWSSFVFETVWARRALSFVLRMGKHWHFHAWYWKALTEAGLTPENYMGYSFRNRAATTEVACGVLRCAGGRTQLPMIARH